MRRLINYVIRSKCDLSDIPVWWKGVPMNAIRYATIKANQK